MDERQTDYTVLARRFRPQTFEEVVGQEHVARSLRNAIQTGRVAHAYLFTGARGVGKTSMARILAKSLNCPDAQDARPCNQCEVCESISTGHDVDVLEIDGASNRGIDDIRLLRSNVSVKSMRTRYKVYIIDEVHMLTKDAFNALLKTLEEPPPNVKFVFCTTEPNKLPDTILSRCQRFDFSTIETARIIDRLGQIVSAEGMEVDPAALELVARRAAGSMRDSQSLLDQLLAFGEGRISSETVHQLMGTASDDRLLAIADALASRQRDQVLILFGEALDAGVQLSELTDQLIAYFRDLMTLAAGAEQVSLLSVSDAHRPQLAQQAKVWGLQTVVAAMQILAEAKSRMQRVTYGRALAELALIRVSLLEDLDSLDGLIEQLRGGESHAAPARVPSKPAAQKKNDLAPPAQAQSAQPAQPAQQPDEIAKRSPQTTEAQIDVAPATAPPTVDEKNLLAHQELRQGTEQQVWSEIVSRMDEQHRSYLHCIGSVAISGPNRLVLTFPKRYHFNKHYCERPDILGQLERLASQVTGQTIRISLATAEDEAAGSVESPPAASRTSRRRPQDVDDPFVQQAESVFGATIVDVREIADAPPRKD